MIANLIEQILRSRTLLWVFIAVAVPLSLAAIVAAPLDAIPDIADPQIIVYAKWPRSPELLESEITEPLVKSLVGSAAIRSVRATSHMGYCFVYVILNSAAQRDAVRQLVADRINALRPRLPAAAAISIGPNASSMGWIYQYALIDHDGAHDLRELRVLNESQVKPALQSSPGVAEVASVGGLEKQYQLKIFPPILADTGISLNQLVTAIQAAFPDAGGRTVEVTNRDYQIRGSIAYNSIDKLELMVIGRDRAGKPVQVKDVGYIQVGYDQRRGIADLDGGGEVVGGIVIMEQAQNVLGVMRTLEKKLHSIRATLPKGVEIVTTYDRSQLIGETLRHFIATLAYELVVVIGVTVLFLRNARVAVAPVSIMLLGVLFTAVPLFAFRQTINLFSLAGLFIAIGEMVDATIVIVENCTAGLAARPDADDSERRRIILNSIATIARPMLFSLLIILASFLPVFFLGQKEGRMFDPLAYSKTFAMTFSTLLTLFLLPMIAIWIFARKDSGHQGAGSLASTGQYRRALNVAIRYRYPFLVGSVLLLGLAAALLHGFRKDFMPQMEEGAILYMPTTGPGIPMKEAGWILQQIDKKLAAFPEVTRVFGKLGRGDTATDPAPVSMIESTVLLKPRAQWRKGMSKDKLIMEMDQAMQIIGYANRY